MPTLPPLGTSSALPETTFAQAPRASLCAHKQIPLRVCGVVLLLPCGCVWPARKWLLAGSECAAPPSSGHPSAPQETTFAQAHIASLRAHKQIQLHVCGVVPLLPCGCVWPAHKWPIAVRACAAHPSSGHPSAIQETMCTGAHSIFACPQSNRFSCARVVLCRCCLAAVSGLLTNG